MKNRLLPLLSLIICFLTQPVFAQQTYMVKGYVFNVENEQPIFNANIIISGTQTGTSSDSKGFFELKLAGGEFKLSISSVGFSGKEISILVPSDTEDLFRVGMQSKKQEIKDVDVFGNFILAGSDTSINRVPLSVLPAITTISAVEIEKQGAVTLTDAMKYVPGGWTESRGRKSKQFFSVRGQKYPYPDYSIDGIWQKEFEETAYFLSALDIESVEIVRSSHALVKGLSGLTGVIEVKTKKPNRETLSFLSKYGENNNYVANLQYGNKINDLSFTTAMAFFGTNGIPDRRGKERIANFHGNMDWKLNEKLSFVAGATYISGSREFISIVEPGDPKILNREEDFDPIKTLVSYVKLNYVAEDGSQTELQTNYTFRNAEYLNYNIPKETTTTHADKDWEYGLNLLHSRSLSQSNTLRIGALYNHWIAPDGKRYYEGRTCNVHSWSGVLADEQKIGRFLFDAGLRLIGGQIVEWGGFGIEGSGAGFQNVAPIENQAAPIEWQSAFGGSYVLSNAASLHYNFSGGTIAPRKGSLESDGLLPENEVRFQHDLGFRIKSKNQNELTVSSFYTKRKNALDLSGETLVSENDLLVELYENMDKRSYGLELASRLNIPALHTFAFANATFMKSEKDVGGKMIDDSKIPDVILNGGLLFEHSGVDANLFIHYTGPYSNNRFVNPNWVAANGDYPLGNFVTADVTCGYTFSSKIQTRIFVEVKNILDNKYETVAGYPDVGRLIQAGIKLGY